MLDIYVDADACPVKDEVMKVADRHKLSVYLVSNSWMRPLNRPNVQLIRVESGADKADDWIVEHISRGDIVITADIPLAQRCLQHGASAVNPFGKAFTEDNIGNALAGRELSSHLRELGEHNYNPSFTPRDRSQFLQAMEAAVQAIKRQG